MAALWLAGTLGATGVVFTAVGKLSTNLSSIGDDTRSARLGPGSPRTTTSVAPFITTTSSSSIAVDPTALETVAETTTSSRVDAPVEDTTVPPDTQPPSARPTAVRTTLVAPPTVPVVLTTAPAPPIAPPTAAPPTNPPETNPTTTFATDDCISGRKLLPGRNTVKYLVCRAGVSLTQALPAPGWYVQQPTVVGPPLVTVIFANGSTSVTCTLRPYGDGTVDTNDC